MDEEETEPQQLLVDGVRAGDATVVAAAIARGGDVNKWLPDDDPSESRASILVLAAYLGHNHLIPVLLKAGACVDDGGGFGYTPLQVAVHFGHDRVVDELMKANPDVNAKDKEGVSTLHLAARKGREYCAKVLISAGADLDARDQNMRTPLHVSVFGKSTNIMKLLLEAGCDPKATNDQGFSVLHIAALSGNEKAIQELRMVGLEADNKDTMGLTPEEVAETWGSHGTAWLLRKMPKSARITYLDTTSTSLHTMLRRSWNEYETEGEKTFQWAKDGRSYLLEANTPVNRDPNYQDEAGFTPIHWAAKLGFTLTVRSLLKSCSSYPGAVNYAGKTPAQLAEEAGHTMLAKELRTNSSKEVDLPVELYWKLLITISVKDDISEAGLLLSSGAPLQATHDLHTNALILAITCNRPRIVTLLAAAGAPLTTITEGLSILQVAWLTPDVTIRVKVLVTRLFLNVLKAEQRRVRPEDATLRKGIELLLNSLRGDKPWQTSWPYRQPAYSHLTSLLVAAARNNCPLTATFLRLCGGMTFKHDDAGTTPFHAAVRANHLDMAKAMVRDLGACPYVADSNGNFPLDLLQDNLREQLEEDIYQRERSQILHYQEEAKDEEIKNYYEEVCEVLDALFGKYLDLYTRTPSKALLKQALLVSSRRGMHLLTYLVIRVGGLSVNSVIDPTQDSTALHQAASHGYSVCVSLLLGLGACVFKADRYGHTPAHLAAMFCHKLTYRILIRRMNHKNPLNRAGRTHQYLARSFKGYLKLYDKVNLLDPRNTTVRFNDPSVAIKELLQEKNLSREMKRVKRILVDFTQGEAREVKEAVVKEISALMSEVAQRNHMYKGRLVLVGSSADNTRLYAPDEFDINLVVCGLEDVEVAVEELESHEALLKGHTHRAQVRTRHTGLQGIAFKSNLYHLMRKSLVTHHITDTRLSYVPPGLERTQAGVMMSMAWQGDKYPLLLINVDVVPVMSVPWPQQLDRPQLTPKSMSRVFLTNTGDGEWRFSLAGAEAEVLGGLKWEERMVYVSCKVILSYLKAERWMPRPVKDFYCWWDSRKWRIMVPAGFGVKNTFLRQLEAKRAGKFDWPKDRLSAVATVLRGMCEDFKDPTNGVEGLVPGRIVAYFGGNFEKPKLGEGAPAIIELLEGNTRPDG